MIIRYQHKEKSEDVKDCVFFLTERWLAFGGWNPSLKLLEGDEKFPSAGKYRHVIV